MWLLVDPLDVLMFRDGRPFNAGENNAAQSLFPPSAFTVQGMLRALYIEQSDIKWAGAITDPRIIEAIGTPDDLGGFRMGGPYLVRRTGNAYERLFPFPADLVGDGRGRWRVPSPVEDLQVRVDGLSLHGLDVDPDEEAPDRPLWLTESDLYDYVEGRSVEGVEQEELFCYEYRTGIGIDQTQRSVSDGLLYAAKFVRLQTDVALVVWLPDDSPLAPLFANSQHHTMRFGGEGHMAVISRLNDNDLYTQSFPSQPPDDKYKVVFLTPTYFAGGTLPIMQNDVVRQSLISASYGNALSIGGWNLSERKPRSIYRYLPAGSVMLFDAARADNAKVSSPLVDQPEDSLPLLPLGFGEFIYGSWEWGAR